MAWQMQAQQAQRQMRPQSQGQMPPPPPQKQQQRPQMHQQVQAPRGAGKVGKGGKGSARSAQAAAQAVIPRPPGQSQARPQSLSSANTIIVSGCRTAMVSSIIQGTYTISGNNHGKPIYKKENATAPNASVLIYYWDDRDGPKFSGWWFGPKVGGDQVWSHADDRNSPVPPVDGWHVPWDGALDPTLKLSHAGSARAGPLVNKGQPRPPMKVDVQANRAALERKQDARPEEKRLDMEAYRKRQEDLKRNKDEESQKRKEQVAATAVRRILHKVRTANPETFDSIRLQLEEAIASHLEGMGNTASKVGQEAEEALLEGQKRIEELYEERAQEEKKRHEEEQRLRHESENSAQLFEDAKLDAEKQLQKLQEAEQMCKELEECDPMKLLERGEALEKVSATRDEAMVAKEELFVKQRSLGDRRMRGELGELQKIFTKVSERLRGLDVQLRGLQSRRAKVAGNAVAIKKLNERKAAFSKFADKDGKLNRKEVEAYAKATINFDLPPAVLDAIVQKLEPITFSNFRSLHQRLHIAKSELLAREARAVQEAKQASLEGKRQTLMNVVLEADELQKEAEAAIAEAERRRPLLRTADAALDDLEAAIQELGGLLQRSKEVMSQSSSKQKAAQESQVDDLQTCGEHELTRLSQREKQNESRLERLEELKSKLGVKVQRKVLAEMEQKRTEVVHALWRKTFEEGTTDFFAGGGDMSREKFCELLGSLDVELTDAERDKLFKHVAGEGPMDQDCFKEMMKLSYTCIKPTVMNQDVSIKSKSVRRLEPGEILEALDGPRNEEVAKVLRLRCRAGDGLEGWVTYKGNQGTPFLEPGGQHYICVQPTELTETPAPRSLQSGEVVRVIELGKTDGADGDVRRLKGKTSDGAVGWMTISDASGTFLEPL